MTWRKGVESKVRVCLRTGPGSRDPCAVKSNTKTLCGITATDFTKGPKP